jgi:flagellar hook-associated protein 3 FlgL
VSARITSLMTSRSVLADLNEVASRMSATQRKLSSGKQITRPSDDPFGAGRAVILRGQLDGIRQQQKNAADGQAWIAVTDGALDKLGEIAQRARELVVQGSSDGASPTARAAIAAEIDQLIDAAKGEASASYGGRFVLSGTATTTRPYASGASDAYAGNSGTIAREIGPGVSVQVNALGSDVLGSGQPANDNRLLHVLRDIADDLRGATPANADDLRGTDLQRLDQNLDNLSQLRATVGATANRMESAASRLAESEETATGLLSDTESADMAKTLMDFSMQQTAYQSALHSGASIVQASLMDWLR